MSERPGLPAMQPFFLDTVRGTRFCLYHAPPTGTECRGAFLYIHPFAEEMNKSRRMAALQARAFAATGFAVLQIDLFGCGDSAGEFGNARWEIWKEDLAAARQWLVERVAAPVHLWGLRLGALLALDFARSRGDAIDSIVLWQPVMRGESFMTQFLRLRLADDMLAGRAEQNGGTRALRDALARGEALEIAGYDIAPALAAEIDTLDAAAWSGIGSAIHWFEISADANRPLPHASAQLIAAWRDEGADVRLHPVQGAPFWSAPEIAECPELLSATAAIFHPVHA
ncbi:hydrolase 2, exosortase A system-associated [Noviherbaspirillum cavernae]|uniref:Hydrolase 2, exosortase A system-associated n=1 Tax=Noviherbaspirillum cavernae TaxID=2320862 RepID=A0A418X3Q8_9BURK|nr:hydrolase 2, exosortase A system-associated [Noviherbaspirillum cavernae]RJG07066.1 hydrolase 2, exosortase A system-associated [Noviherbaspirillum cavernae]